MTEDKNLTRKSRYNVGLPQEMNEELLRVAEEHNIPVQDLIRRYVQLGLIESKTGPFTYIDEEGNQVEIEVFPDEQLDKKKRLWLEDA